MAINDRDFYTSHGLDFNYKNMLDEYIKGVVNQAKIEVLTEIQAEIEELQGKYSPYYDEASQHTSEIIQEKINALKENNNETHD